MLAGEPSRHGTHQHLLPVTLVPPVSCTTWLGRRRRVAHATHVLSQKVTSAASASRGRLLRCRFLSGLRSIRLHRGLLARVRRRAANQSAAPDSAELTAVGAFDVAGAGVRAAGGINCATQSRHLAKRPRGCLEQERTRVPLPRRCSFRLRCRARIVRQCPDVRWVKALRAQPA